MFEKVSSALRWMAKHKSFGPDEVPAQVLELLDDDNRRWFGAFFGRCTAPKWYQTIWSRQRGLPSSKKGASDCTEITGPSCCEDPCASCARPSKATADRWGGTVRAGNPLRLFRPARSRLYGVRRMSNMFERGARWIQRGGGVAGLNSGLLTESGVKSLGNRWPGTGCRRVWRQLSRVYTATHDAGVRKAGRSLVGGGKNGAHGKIVRPAMSAMWADVKGVLRGSGARSGS